MCINTKYSMSIIEKVFKYGETELSVIKCKDDIWLRGKTLAEVLGYSNPLKAIRMHIDSEDKKEMSELDYKGGGQKGVLRTSRLRRCTANSLQRGFCTIIVASTQLI